MHVLLVEDNILDTTESLHSSLKEQGHNVCLVHTPETAAQKLGALWPNLILFNPAGTQLDISTFQQAINETRLDIPYIVVGDKNKLHHKINNDTIVVAPRKPKQLTQSLKTVQNKQKGRFFRFPNLTIDCLRYKVLRNGKTYSLTPKEFKLLHLLVDNCNQVLSRKTIMQTVWETDYMGDTRTLDVHIRWLREKIEENPSRPQRLITIRGLGYRFVDEPEAE